MVRLRLAPTPSGFLHRGNALNFVLTWWHARSLKGELFLRIDDHDTTRTRDEYLEDIFWTIEWLGLDIDQGPQDVDDFKSHFSQTHKFSYYKEELLKVKETALFGCLCSRKDVKENGGEHPRECRDKMRTFDLDDFEDEEKEMSLRMSTENIKVPDASYVDCVLWRKENIPSYQLVNLVEDRDMEITHLVRGMDLSPSSQFQQEVSHLWQWDFPSKIYHHSLLTDHGEKLSKTQKSPALREEFNKKEDFYLEVVSPYIGHKVKGTHDLLQIEAPFFTIKEKTERL